MAQSVASTNGRGRGRDGNRKPTGKRSVTHTVAAPTKSSGLARVYAVKEPRKRSTTDVIAGTFLLKSFSLFLLIDLDSTHSYIMGNLASKLRILVETISQGMVVMSSLGGSVLVDQVYQRFSLAVQ